MKESIVRKIQLHSVLYEQYGKKPPALAITQEEADFLKEILSCFCVKESPENDYIIEFYGVKLHIIK